MTYTTTKVSESEELRDRESPIVVRPIPGDEKYLSGLYTRKEMYVLHYKMWSWLADNPDKAKDDWFYAYWPSEYRHIRARSLCFLCEVFWESSCTGCPLYELSRPRKYCDQDGSLFAVWQNISSVQRKEYARKIADCVLEELAKM
jgi:hypothetical protein